MGLIILPFQSVNSFISHYDSTSLVINNLESENASVFDEFQLLNTDSLELSKAEAAETNSIIWPTKWEWLSYVWILGFVICLIRMTGSFFYLNRLNRKAELMSFEEINHKLNSIKEGFGIKREIILKTSERIVSPLIYGIFKPVIIFPLGLVQGLTTEEVEAILLHELSHLKRNDFIINIIINLLKTIYFYHPAFWWMSAQLENE